MMKKILALAVPAALALAACGQPTAENAASTETTIANDEFAVNEMLGNEAAAVNGNAIDTNAADVAGNAL